LDWTHTTLWMALRPSFLGVFRQGKAIESEEIQQALDQLAGPVATLEGLLDGRDYVGGTFGIGDIPPAISLSRYQALGRDLAPWPKVDAWYQRLAARPAFKARVFVDG